MSQDAGGETPRNDGPPVDRHDANGAPAERGHEEPVCAICGHPIAPDDVVCPSCGTSLAAG